MNHELIKILEQIHLLEEGPQAIVCQAIHSWDYYSPCNYIRCCNCPLASKDDFKIHYINLIDKAMKGIYEPTIDRDNTKYL